MKQTTPNFGQIVRRVYEVTKLSLHYNKIDTHTFSLKVAALHPKIKVTTAERYLRAYRASDRRQAKLAAS